MEQKKQAEQTGEPEAKKQRRQLRFRFRAVLTMAILYAIQFLILPPLFPGYFPGTTNEATAIFLVSSALGLILGFRFAEQRFLPWLIADAVYVVLILLYCAEGAYGIGLRGIALDGVRTYFDQSAAAFGALICLCVILAMQLILKGIFCAANRLRRKAC